MCKREVWHDPSYGFHERVGGKFCVTQSRWEQLPGRWDDQLALDGLGIERQCNKGVISGYQAQKWGLYNF